MTEGDATAGTLKETTVFLSHFKDLPDYRQKGKVAYPLEEVLLLLLAAALAGVVFFYRLFGKRWTEMFGPASDLIGAGDESFPLPLV